MSRSGLPRRGPRGEILRELHEGLPDSARPRGLCPRCGKQSSFYSAGSLPVTLEYGVRVPGTEKKYDSIDRVTAFICHGCGQGVAVVEEQWIGEAPTRQSEQVGKLNGTILYRGVHWWLPDVNLSGDIPETIADAYAEAANALNARCPRASAVMARRTLEAVADDQGEKKGKLADRLEALAAKGTLQPNLAAWAREVRLVGNVGAHFDPLQSVSVEDAQQLLSFSRELLRYLYELPAELQRRRR